MAYSIRNKSRDELIEQLEAQAETIRNERQSRMEAFRENHDLNEKIRFLERRLEYYRNDYMQRPNMRADQNWDGGFRAEVSE